MSLSRFWAFLAIALPALAATIAVLPSVDLTYHLRAGAIILDTGAIPRTDTFTFTAAGLPWQNQQWAAQVILAGMFRMAGWTGLVLLRAALVGIAFGLLSDICRRRSGSIRIGAWLTLAAFVASAVTLGLRPQLFAIALFVAILWLVDRRVERPRLLLLAVPLVAAWVNLHGSFFLGPGLLALALVEDLVERRATARWSAVALAASLAATLANPFGLGAWSYVAGISTNPVITDRITEWQTTSPLSAEGALFYVSVALVVLALVVTARRRVAIRPAALIWLLPFLLIGAYAVRGLAWWPFVAAAVVAGLAAPRAGAHEPSTTSQSGRDGTRLMRRLNVVVAGILVVSGVAALPAWRPTDQGLRAPAGLVAIAPSEITGVLRDLAESGDRLLAPQPWGSWFEFALPELPVAVDSRIELFPAAVWDAIDRIEAGDPGWETDLDAWKVSIVVVTAANHGLRDRLLGAGWTSVHEDADGTILVRSDRPR